MKHLHQWMAALAFFSCTIMASPREEMLSSLEALQNDPSLSVADVVKSSKETSSRAASRGWFDIAYLADSYAIEGLAYLSQFDQVKHMFQSNRTNPQAEFQPGSQSRFLDAILRVYDIHGNKDAAASVYAQLESLQSNPKLTGYDKAKTLSSLGSAAFMLGKFGAGLDWLRASDEFLSSIEGEPSRKRRAQLSVIVQLGNQYFSMKDFKNAQRHYTRGLQIANNLKNAATQSTLHFNLSLTYLETKDWGLAYKHAEIASGISHKNNEPINYGNGMEVMAKSLLEQGRALEAEAYQKKALDVFRANNLNEYVFLGLVYLADIYIESGRANDAESTLMQARQLEAYYQGAAEDIEYARVQYKVAQLTGNYRQANELMERYIALIKDDFQERESAQAQRLIVEYEVESVQSKAEALALDNASKNQKLAKKDADSVLMYALALTALFAICILALFTLRERKNRRKMHRLAMTDPLTGAPNRRSMEESAIKLLRSQSMTPSRIGVALLDIDHFKQINDIHGHDIGDVVLKTFVETCRPLLREGDVLGRWGGEEFLLLLPNASQEAVQQVFSRLQHALLTMECVAGDIPVRLTVSMGATLICTADDSAFGKDLIGRAIKQADDCVYLAKGGGRNRLVVYKQEQQYC
jgi:diguanylate cyclase (GGDEF)-like protein